MDRKIALKKDFELIEFIGQGLSSEVYRGLRFDETSDFSETVAIKVFKSSKFRKKYQNELKNLSKINHSNIISVKDWGEYEEKFYLVTDYIHGRNLLEVFKDLKTKDIKLKKYILNQIYAGIYALKNKSIAHGDLKPSNIMLSVHGDLKLIDISFNKLGQVFATPDFSAPEVLSGAWPSFESDLYSLGKIAEMMGIKLSKALALEPGDRSFEDFRGIDEADQKLNVSKFIISVLTSEPETAAEFDETQELHASSAGYNSVKSPNSTLKTCLKVSLHLGFALIFGFGLLPNYPEVRTLKLRSLKAYEYWNDQSWVSLPADINLLFRPFESKVIKLRSPKGETKYIVSADMDFSKSVIIDAL